MNFRTTAAQSFYICSARNKISGMPEHLFLLQSLPKAEKIYLKKSNSKEVT